MHAQAVRMATPAPSVVAQQVGADIVILDLDSGVYFSLNEVGAQIWKGLESGVDTDTIGDRIAAEFEIERPLLDADIEAFLDALVSHGLVVPG